jgi:hypothetical protein
VEFPLTSMCSQDVVRSASNKFPQRQRRFKLRLHCVPRASPKGRGTKASDKPRVFVCVCTNRARVCAFSSNLVGTYCKPPCDIYKTHMCVCARFFCAGLYHPMDPLKPCQLHKLFNVWNYLMCVALFAHRVRVHSLHALRVTTICKLYNEVSVPVELWLHTPVPD